MHLKIGKKLLSFIGKAHAEEFFPCCDAEGLKANCDLFSVEEMRFNSIRFMSCRYHSRKTVLKTRIHLSIYYEVGLRWQLFEAVVARVLISGTFYFCLAARRKILDIAVGLLESCVLEGRCLKSPNQQPFYSMQGKIVWKMMVFV